MDANKPTSRGTRPDAYDEPESESFAATTSRLRKAKYSSGMVSDYLHPTPAQAQ